MVLATAPNAEAGGSRMGISSFPGSGGSLSSHIGGRSGFPARPTILPPTRPGWVGHQHGHHPPFGKHPGYGSGYPVFGGFGAGAHRHFPGCGHGPYYGLGFGGYHGRSGVAVILNFGPNSHIDHIGYYCTLCNLWWDSKLEYLDHLHQHHHIGYGYAASHLAWDSGNSVFFFQFD